MANGRNLLANAATGILVLCAFVVTALSVHQYLSLRQAEGEPIKHVSDWQHLVTNRSADIGDDHATLKIVEFSDYQCPYCKALESNLQALVEKNRNKVAIVRYDLPLKDIHEYAYKAAIAAKCAAIQGVREAFEAKLFKADLAKTDWNDLARQANIPDFPQFSLCVDGNKTAALVDADIEAADKLGIKGTPTLLINGNIVAGMQSEEALNDLISKN